MIPPAPPTDNSVRIGWNILRETIEVTRQAAANRPVWLSILGLSWFWAIGATLLSEFPTLARDTLGADGHVVTLLLTMFAVGVGVGSMLCAACCAARSAPATFRSPRSASPCSPGISHLP